MLGKSQVVDLSQTQGEATPHHGSQVAGENERSSPAQRVPATGEFMTYLFLPSTVLNGKLTVAQIPVRDLLAQAVVVDLASQVAHATDYRLTVEDLRAWERRHGRIPKGSMVLLHTGGGRGNEGNPAHFPNQDPQGTPRVPGMSPQSVAFLVSERDIRGVGLDTWVPQTALEGLGVEDGTRALLSAGKWQLVNLTNLDRLPAKGSKLVIAPLRVDAERAPARVIAILP